MTARQQVARLLPLALLFVLHRRERAARKAVTGKPYAGSDEISPSRALRFTLRYLLAGCMTAVAVALIADLHLHFFAKPKTRPRLPAPTAHPSAGPLPPPSSSSFHIPVGPILYGLLIVVLIAAVAVSIWWSTRLRHPAPTRVIVDAPADELREAVTEGRAALARIDDAQAAIAAARRSRRRAPFPATPSAAGWST
jgi:hypothetical protein